MLFRSAGEDWRARDEKHASGVPLSERGIERNTRPRRTLKPPVTTRSLSKAEQIILYKASYLNNYKFPPWTVPPAPDEFELKDGETWYLWVVE